MHMLTQNGSARTDELQNPQSGLEHQDIFERGSGRWILTITNDRVWKWADNDHYVITERREVYDTDTGRLVNPEPGRAYHSILETVSGGRRVHSRGDIRTGKPIGPDVGSDGPIWTGYSDQTEKSLLLPVSSGSWIWRTTASIIRRRYIPNKPITSDRDILSLWAEVLSRHELTGGGILLKLGGGLGETTTTLVRDAHRELLADIEGRG